MKALFEHNGFTRMEEVPDNAPQFYNVPISASINVTDPISVPSSISMDVWQFRLYDITYVDNERVAVYKYVGKR